MIADRAGEFTANAPDCTATSANSTHSCVVAQPRLGGQRDGRHPRHHRRDERHPAAVVVVDDRAAVQPEDHQRHQRAQASSPTDAVDPEISYTCSPTATTVSCAPRLEIARPHHSRRNAGLTRSGVVSTTSEGIGRV